MRNQPSTQKEIPHNISYTVLGYGKPLMLLHGFAEDASIWENQIAHLSAKYKLILPDLPGTGLSKEFPATPHSTIDDFARLILQIADAEELEQFTLIGHSMGGYITLAFAELFPERLDGFGLIHSTAFADSDEKKENRKKSIEFIHKYGALRFLETMIPGLYTEAFALNHPDVIQDHIKPASGFKDSVFTSFYEMMMKRPDRRHVLEKFPKPILFVIGTEDKAVHLNESLDQCQLPVDHQVYILKNVGHMGMKEDPSIVNKALEEFLTYINKK